MSNRLSLERSPYLLQHADNPVDWRPWGPEVFEEAKRTGKLDDYAFYAYGLLELYGVTFDPAYLTRAIALADLLLKYFFDREYAGFYPYTSDGEQLLTRTKEAYD